MQFWIKILLISASQIEVHFCNPALQEIIVFGNSSFLRTPRDMVNLTANQKHAAFVILSQHLDDTTGSGIKHGVLTNVAKKFAVDKSTICRLWRESRTIMTSQNLSVDDLIKDASNKMMKTF